MIIEGGTEMLLFRYKNYRHNEFINEHLSVLDDNGYVWLLKVGKRTSVSKLHSIIDSGGWMLLRAPKANKGECYLAKYEEISEENPKDAIYPEYYHEILAANYDDDTFGYEPSYQWFKIVFLERLDEKYKNVFILEKTGKNINEVISTTRTAVMFIKPTEDIRINKVIGAK